ncbi:unnamed protein product, partial [marine sediment metagenome]
EEKQRGLTKSELQKAFVDDIITKDQFLQGLHDLDYSEIAIAVILETVMSAKARVEVEVLPLEKELSKAELQRTYLEDVIGIKELDSKLVALGYSRNAINLSIELVEKQRLENEEKELPPEAIDTRKTLQVAYVEGKIDRSNISSLLTDMGYTEEGIRIVIKYAHESI